MSNDSFTKVSTQSWMSRIGSSFVGIIVGLLLFILSFPLLYWNEGRAVHRIHTLEEGQGIVVDIDANHINSANNNRLVHATALANTSEQLSDSIFRLSENAIKLRRIVKMYQWQQETDSRSEKQLGGSQQTVTTYRYTKTWSSSLINSNNFEHPNGHRNPAAMEISNREMQANHVNLGEFNLPFDMVNRINAYEKVDIDPSKPVPEEYGDKLRHYDGGYYYGDSPSEPAIGDLRINFEVIRPLMISLIAQQIGNSFQAYKTKSGGSISLLQVGNYDSAAMFSQAFTENTILTWILRVVGFLIMTIGLNLISRPLAVLADVVPFIGSIVSSVTGLAAFLLAIALSFTTIAIAWIIYRPVVGAILLAVALFFTWLVKQRTKSVKLRMSLA